MIPVKGGSVRTLATVNQNSYYASYLVYDRAPDGRHIAFAGATEIDSAQDIWVMKNFLPGSGAPSGQ